MLIAFACAALLCGTVQDPVRVSASLSAQRINVGGTTTLQVVVETRGAAPEEIRLPALSRDLDILGTSDYTQTQISVPGGRTRATRREIVIVARNAGIYRIPPVIVRVAGVTYRTDPLDLIVRAGGAGAAGGRFEATSSLNVTLSADTVYVGEQVLLRAEATFAEEMRTRQSRPATFDPPAPTGFWIQDLPDPISVTLRVREGRTVETQTYRRAYFPLAPGEYRFPPARLHYEVRRGFLYAPETRELVSDSAPIVVLPVPDAGRPASYNGAVGNLTLDASIEPSRLRAGDPAMLTVTINGTGNVKALPVPVLPVMTGVEIFPPSQDSRVDVSDDRVGGMKRFRWMLVPGEPGPFAIPPIEYGVFDPELRTYVVLRTDSLRIDVAPAVVAEATGSALRPLRTRPGHARLGWVHSPAFVALQALPLLLLAGIVGVRRRRERPPGPRDIARELRSRLDPLRGNGPSAGLLAELERIARAAAVHVAGIEDNDPVAALRRQKRPAAATELDSLLRELHRLRFAPAAPYDADALIDRVSALIRMLEPRRGWKGSARVSAMVVLTAVPVAIGAQGHERALFVSAVQHYELGDYAAAVTTFHEYARRVPNDAAGWYNLGLAAHHAGDPGRASWAWLRTVHISPRDRDARHNLRSTGAGNALARIQPIDWLSTRERTLTAAVGWWLLLAGVTFGVLRSRPRWSLLVPGALILVVAAIGAASQAARPTLITPMSSGARLYASPTVRDAALGDLPAGAVARLVDRRSGWLLVRTEDGSEAWVERNAVAAP